MMTGEPQYDLDYEYVVRTAYRDRRSTAFRLPPWMPRKTKAAAGTNSCCRYICIRHLFHARKEYRVSAGGSRHRSLSRAHESDNVLNGWGSKRPVVVTVAGSSHTDDVACRKKKEVGDPVSRSLSTG